MQQSELISIVIPYYNNHLYINELLESIKTQFYKNKEVVVVDDGSEQKSSEFLKQTIDSFKLCFPIQLKTQSNQGVAVARNVGMSLVRGEYITFIDGDDMLCGRYSLLSRITFLQKNPKYSAVAGYPVMINQNGTAINKESRVAIAKIYTDACSDDQNVLYYYCKNIVENTINTAVTLFFVTGSALYRTAECNQFSFDKNFDSEDDVEWALRFLKKNALSLQLTPFHFRRIHENQYHLNTPKSVTQKVIELAKKVLEEKI